jgi:hypothetical protein
MSQGRFMLAVVLSLGATQAFAGGTTTTTVVSSTTSTTSIASTTSTTTLGSTTSTTLPCTDEQTLDSAACRLDDLATRVGNDAGLASIASKLQKALDIAENNVNDASAECDAGDAKAAGKKLKKAVRRLIQYGHRLRSLKSRKNIPAEIRQPYVDDGKAIQDDLKALKKALVCPPASPSGAFLSS